MRILFIFLLFIPCLLMAQKKALVNTGIMRAPCSDPGTVPPKAIPVCGIKVFIQNDVTSCTGPDIAQTFCPGDPFPSTSSFWYKFNCFTDGTLGFLITPNSPNDDYDWALFDVTGANPNDVFTSPRLVISINGSSPIGLITGCDATGTSNVNCYSSIDVMNKMETILAGHKYLLMVTNYTNSGLGYGLSFSGTADISDGTLPLIDRIEPGCSNIKVFFSTDIKCSSITNSGSEFTIGPGINPIAGVRSDCDAGFISANSLIIDLVNPLVPLTNYTITINKGSDNTTFSNICDDQLLAGTQLNFSLPKPTGNFPQPPETCLGDVTNFSSTSNPGTGATVANWFWNFGDGNTAIKENPGNTYTTAGTYTVKHWIVNSLGCTSDTAIRTVVINDLPTVNFSFTPPSCETRNIVFTDASLPITGTISTWAWDFGDGGTSSQQNAVHVFAAAGTFAVKLTVTTSKGCTSSVSKTITINTRPAAGFINPEVCLNDTYAQFTDTSKIAAGTISNWAWNFGDPVSGAANVSSIRNPQHSYSATGPYNVRLIVTSNLGCKDTLTQAIFVNGSFPVSDFSVPAAGALCANETVIIKNLSAVFPGNITKLEIYWDNTGLPAVFDLDDNPFTGKTYSHLYPNFQSPLTKNFTIRVKAYSGGICANDKTQVITVNASPKVLFAAIPDICFDALPYQFTQAAEAGGVPGGGVYAGPGTTGAGVFSPQTAGIGTHIIKYVYGAAAGCRDSMTQTIKVIDTAAAKFSFTSPVCDGDPAGFTDQSVAPAGVVLSTVTWNFGDGSPVQIRPAGTTISHTFPAWGDYTVTMFNTSSYGCRSTVTTRRVHISPQPAPLFSFLQSSVCLPGALVTMVNSSTIADAGALTYSWNFGDGSPVSTAAAPSHIFPGIGPYMVTLTAKSTDGCTRIFSKLVDFIHPQPKAAFTLSKPHICLGDDVVFTDITNPLDGFTTEWHWNLGDGSLRSIPAFTYTYTDTLEYSNSLYTVNSNGCHSDTLNRLFKVYPNPTAFAGLDKKVLQGNSIAMDDATAAGVNLQYLWLPNLYFINGENRVLRPVAADVREDITYTLFAVARGGCTRTDQVFIKVLKPPAIPNTFTPNNDGTNDFWIITYLNDYTDCRVQVFTRMGQLVYLSGRGYRTPWNGNRNGKPLPFDTYYYIIEPGNGRLPLTGYVTIVK
jgi:gliding motility-associated-like protein